MKTTPYTGHKPYAFESAPRCNAKTRHNNGSPCRSPPVRGKNRCRMHGGAKGSGAKHNNQNALKHGLTTREAKLHRREIREAIKQWKKDAKIELIADVICALNGR
jgi:hypothetical protein